MSTRRCAEWRLERKDAKQEKTCRLAVLSTPAHIVFVAVAIVLANGPLDGIVSLGVGALGVLLFLQRRRSRFGERLSLALAESAPWPLAPRTLPVYLAYWREFDLVAEDEAMVSFGDGWMSVEGPRASFSLRPTGVYVLHAGRNGCDPLFEGGERVEGRPYAGPTVEGEALRALRNRFEIALDLWHDGEVGEGSSLLAPDWSRSFDGENRTAATGLTGTVLFGIAVSVLTQAAPPQVWIVVSALLRSVGRLPGRKSPPGPTSFRDEKGSVAHAPVDGYSSS